MSDLAPNESRQTLAVTGHDGEIVVQFGTAAYIRLRPEEAILLATKIIKEARKV